MKQLQDFIIKNVRIIDGTGAPYFHGEAAVRDGFITQTCRKAFGDAVRVIDGRGMVLAPGFIDSHSHSDVTWFFDPRGESKLMQGVTTEVNGQCGGSAAPVTEKRKAAQVASESNEDLRTFPTFAAYMDALERNGVGLNIAPLVGHGVVRSSAMGYEDRRPTPSELNEMKGFIVEAMEAGAFGYSSGLIYPPSSYAKTDELIELAKAMAPYGGIYATHMRNEGADLLESVQEAITIGREAGVRVQISHHKATGTEKVWGLVNDSLKMIELAREQGLDVQCDQYPYTASATSFATNIPAWAHEGGPKALLGRLKHPESSARIKEEWEAKRKDGGWSHLMIASVASARNRFAQGKRVPEVAEIWGIPEVDAAVRLLIEEELQVREADFGMCEEDVRTVMRHPCVMIGSDASATALDGPLAKGFPHPRTFGTFPRVLGKYVREDKVLPLEQAVFKMTGMPAARLHIWDRGVIRPGASADLVLFDPDTITDTATFAAPCQYPKGIHWVMVNGVMAVEGGVHIGRIPGRVLRRPF